MSVYQEYTTVSVGDLKQHPDNPRIGDVNAIQESIKHNGFYGAVIVQKSTGYVLAGNHRLQAAEREGIKNLPTIIIDVDDEVAKRILLADNRTNDLATYDTEALISMLKDNDLSGTGYNIDDLNALINESKETYDIYNPEEFISNPIAEAAQEKWAVKTGDVFSNTDHTIICGDNTDKKIWSYLKDDIDMIFTDPPYGVAYDGGPARNSSTKTISSDESPESARELWQKTLTLLHDRLKPGGVIYAAAAQGPASLAITIPLSNLGLFRHQLIWVKNNSTFNRCDYHYKHEQIVYGWKEGASHTWLNDNKQTSTLNFDRPSKSKEHPTMKPIELVEYLIRNSSNVGDIICDPFLGSGTTSIAAQRAGRKSFCVEISPDYTAISLERLASAGAILERISCLSK